MKLSGISIRVVLGITALLPLVLLQPGTNAQAPRYDLLLKWGHVIDPANGLDAKMDVGVSLGRIAAVEKDIPANQAGKVVDVSGLYVTPGLIDIHYHVGHGGAPLEVQSNDGSFAAPSPLFSDRPRLPP